MGYALARAAEYRGAAVTLVSGPTVLPPPANITVIPVISADQMADAVFAHADDADMIIMAAAVGDYTPMSPASAKIKKTDAQLTVLCDKTCDILAKLGETKKGRVRIGFAAETDNLDENAQKKLVAKHADMIVANRVGQPDTGFASDTNQATLFLANNETYPLPAMSKDALADIILTTSLKTM